MKNKWVADIKQARQRSVNTLEEENLFISNTMSRIAQGVTGASEQERRLAESIANKYRAAAEVKK